MGVGFSQNNNKTLRNKYGKSVLRNSIHSSNRNRVMKEIQQLYGVKNAEEIIQFPFYFRLKNGIFCHTIAENCYENGKVIGIPKYFVSKGSNNIKSRKIDVTNYFRLDSYVESIMYARIFSKCKVSRVDRYGEDLCIFDFSEIEKVYNPFSKALELCNYRGTDVVLKDACRLITILTKEFGIPLSDIGIEGSILLGGYKLESDLDFVVKGFSSVAILKEKFHLLEKHKGIKLYSIEDAELVFSRRKGSKSFGSIKEMMQQEKRRSVGLFNGRRFWIQPIIGNNILEMETRTLTRIGELMSNCTVLKDDFAFFWPSHYKVKDSEGHDYDVECYDPTYMNQAEKNDIVYIKGPVYEDKNTGRKIVILAPWLDEVQKFIKTN